MAITTTSLSLSEILDLRAPFQKKDSGALALFQLVSEGEIESITSLYQEDSNRFNEFLFSRNECQDTPLALAFHQGDKNIVSFLLSIGGARSVFVRGPYLKMILCTLPYAIHPAASSHSSSRGADLAARKLQMMTTAPSDDLLRLLDESLESYVNEIGRSAVQPDVFHANPKGTVSPSSADSTTSPGVSKFASADAGEAFQVGDLVRLRSGVQTSSKPTVTVTVQGRKFFRLSKAAAAACLGRAEEGRLGVVMSSRSCQSGATNTIYKVASIHSGHVCEYMIQDLMYADCSLPGEAQCDGSRTRKPPAKPVAAKPIKVGDKVRVKACVSKPRFGWKNINHGDAGIVTSITSSGGIFVDFPNNSNWMGVVHDMELDAPPARAGAAAATIERFAVGDRVMLNPGFSGQGWNLANGRIGVVTCVAFDNYKPSPALAPVAMGGEGGVRGTGEQRFVMVSSLQAAGDVCAFRASWLTHLPQADPAEVRYRVGDVVQLNPAEYSNSALRRKCLGQPGDLRYGVVTRLGVDRGGIQRNVEVVVPDAHDTGGDDCEKFAVSLYPAFTLMLGERASVLRPEEREGLLRAVGGLMERAGIPVNVQVLVDSFGLRVWSQLWKVCSERCGLETVIRAFHEWQASRETNLFTPAYKMAVEQAKCRHIDGSQSSRAGGSVNQDIKGAASCSEGEATKHYWKCEGCQFSQNAESSVACAVCQKQGSSWACICSVKNRVGSRFCIFCAKPKQVKADADEAEEGEIMEIEDEMEAELFDDNRERITVVHTMVVYNFQEDRGAKAFLQDACSKHGRVVSVFFSADKSEAYVNFACSKDLAKATRAINGKLSGRDGRKLQAVSQGPTLSRTTNLIFNYKCSRCNMFNPLKNSECKLCNSPLPKWLDKALVELHGGNWQSGALVTLSSDYEQFGDPSSGILKPGDLATVMKNTGRESTVEIWKDRTFTFRKEALKLIKDQKAVELPLVPMFPGWSENSAAALREANKTVSCKDKAVPCKDGAVYCEDEVVPCERIRRTSSDSWCSPTTPNYTPTSPYDTPPTPPCSPPESRTSSPFPKAGNENEEDITSLKLEKNEEANQNLRLRGLLNRCSGAQSSVVDESVVQDSRTTSEYFYDLPHYDALGSLDELVGWKDVDGSTAAHHAAFMGLPRTLKALYEAGASKWALNKGGQTPAMLEDGLRILSPEQRVLHRACTKGSFFHHNSRGKTDATKLMQMAIATKSEYQTPEELAEVKQALMEQGGSERALALCRRLVDDHVHARVYMAVAMLDEKFGGKATRLELDRYLSLLISTADTNTVGVDPLFYYAQYQMWISEGRPAGKRDILRAAYAITALRCFPSFAAEWVDQDDDIDSKVIGEGLDVDDEIEEDSGSEESDDDMEVTSVDNPETEWRVAKEHHGMISKSMDELMALTGLTAVKKSAIGVVKKVILQKRRPAGIKADTSMNFLFVGNPGCGKTTVARLLAGAMAELGFRTNPTVQETSAQAILKIAPCPVAGFVNMVKAAEGGTLFIDEAYRFSPNKATGQPNASNGVMDYLLEAVENEKIRDSTTFILAGYKDEIDDLLSYNIGFSSRFSCEFNFPDYNEKQLKHILVGMVKARGFHIDKKKTCGVPIAKVLAQRISRGAGKKGFGNARAVRNKVEEIINNQTQRLGTLELLKKAIAPGDYRILSRVDTIGSRPDFSSSPLLRELDSMVGLTKVKAAFRKLVELQVQNYDREVAGDKPEWISLHRVFYGNPGTGKTTVARLYGALLKDLGLLSKGDFLECTPADLTGDAEGGAASNTKAMLERAKGKVLFIDEAYVLDPNPKGNQYGGNVLDTLVEKLEGEAGSDIAVILAGYKQEMFDMLENNPGLRRRFNIDDFGMCFEDLSDKELRQVLVRMVGKAGLAVESMDVVDSVVSIVAQKRRMPNFGNAGTVASILNVAKVNKASRLTNAVKEQREAMQRGVTPLPELPHRDVLVMLDFVELPAQKFVDPFDGLYNMEHITEILHELEAFITVAKADGKNPADILAGSHMVFVGPPGTGKTTVANKFGVLFKNLGLLPTENVMVVTGTSLQGQYVGETKNKVLKVMQQARGGILFIDEAYGLDTGSHRWVRNFAAEAVETLVGQITSEEFKGNLLVIMAGYADRMDKMFARANPGLRSRFDKRRVTFRPWTSEQAAAVALNEIKKDGKSIAEEGKNQLQRCFGELAALPGWASARDVFETVLPGMYSKRANRMMLHARMMAESDPPIKPPVSAGASGRKAAAAAADPAEFPYDVLDVVGAFEQALRSRSRSGGGRIPSHKSLHEYKGFLSAEYRQGKDGSSGGFSAEAAADVGPAQYENNGSAEVEKSDFSTGLDSPMRDVSGSNDCSDDGGNDNGIGGRSGGGAGAGGRSGVKKNKAVKRKRKHDGEGDQEGDGLDPAAIMVALEAACKAMGYTLDQIEKMLGPGGSYDAAFLKRVMADVGCSDEGVVKAALDIQKPEFLGRVRSLIKERKRAKTEEEKKVQSLIKAMGRCPMDFEWLRVTGGWQCAGGSHFMSDGEIGKCQGDS